MKTSLQELMLTSSSSRSVGVRFNAGETFNVTLNAFEVLALRSVGDLTGTNIMSNDKVQHAVYQRVSA